MAGTVTVLLTGVARTGHHFRLTDMRTIDCRPLLVAPEPGAAVLAVTCR